MRPITPRTPLLAALSIALLAASLPMNQVQAGPAPWYLWRSKLDGQLACSQTPLGPGWQQEAGPFKDSRCEKPLLAK